MRCRFCKHRPLHQFLDLHYAPPSNLFLKKEQLNQPEIYYPLKLFVCEKCWLVQINEYKQANEIFNEEYPYFSSYSSTWLVHAKKYATMAIEKFELDATSKVIEIASNDGYLLQYFKKCKIPCVGIEPTKSTAIIARKKGICVIEAFFGEELAGKMVKQEGYADLIIANNVLAHVPNINDFVRGMKVLLSKNGIITIEFPHLKSIIENNQFDTIYHEHFSYFSLSTVKKIFNYNGLTIFDAEKLDTHGGSLRIYAMHTNIPEYNYSSSLREILSEEKIIGMNTLQYFSNFQKRVKKIRTEFLDFLIQKKRLEKIVVGYGAAAKGVTLLNYCGINNDLIPFVADVSPFKQEKFLPGSHIPVVAEKMIQTVRPDYVCIFPWNIKEEITQQLAYIRKWGGKFVTVIPKLKCFMNMGV